MGLRTKRGGILILLWCGMLWLSLATGRYPLTASQLVAILTGGQVSEVAKNLFWQIRLPRTLLTAMGGGGLALAGLTFQTVFSNPLVSPDVLGVASGASVGAAFAFLFFPWMPFGVEGSALMGGGLAVLMALMLARFVAQNRVLALILSGIVVSSVSDALLMLLKYCADPQNQLPTIEYWLMGGFQNALWQDIWPVALLSLPAVILLHHSRFSLKVLSLGDEEAASLGLRPNLIRLLSVGCATMLTASVVSVAGIVSWVGLIAPHLARQVIPGNLIDRMGSVCLVGSILLLGADLCARTLSAAEIPISIFTSLFGAAFLALLLLQRRWRGEESW